jgi:hypothetical protein
MKIRTAYVVCAAVAVTVTWASAGRSSLDQRAATHASRTHESGMCVEAPVDPPPCAVPPGTGR